MLRRGFLSGRFVDSQSESSSGSSTASGQLDPASDTWSDHASSRFDQDVATVRTSNGSGDYWHDRYGFDVSGTITVANEHRYTSHHSTSHVYADGSLTPESTGSRYTELITHSLLNSSGGGFDDRTLVSSGPILNHLGDAIGSSTSTTTLDHSANEGHLRDFHTSDRSDWRFDLATGTLVPTQRVQVDSHVIDVSLDLVHDTTVQTQRAGSYTLDQRNHEFEGESESRTREAISSGQNSTRTVTRTTPHEGPGAGVTILVVSGTDDVSHHDFAWLQSHSGVSTSEIHGSDGYYRYQTDTDDTLRTTFDSVHSVQRIDGSGDTRYQGNRGLAGDGWNSDWYEETPSGGGIEVSQGSYHLALTHDDDRPNAYDVTVASGSAASVELPGPYRLPTNPQANTPPSGALGPGGFSAPEDPSEVAGLRDQVAAAGSSAAATNAAHNGNFLVLVQSPGNPEIPGTPASENSLQGSATMADYVQSQSSLPMPGNPIAIGMNLPPLPQFVDTGQSGGNTGSNSLWSPRWWITTYASNLHTQIGAASGQIDALGTGLGNAVGTHGWRVFNDPAEELRIVYTGSIDAVIGTGNALINGASTFLHDPIGTVAGTTQALAGGALGTLDEITSDPNASGQMLGNGAVAWASLPSGRIFAKPVGGFLKLAIPGKPFGTLVDKLSPLTRRSGKVLPDRAVAPRSASFIVTPQGLAISSRTLSRQGASHLAGNFQGLAGKSMAEIIERAPSTWKMVPQDRGVGIKFLDELGKERIRIHAPSPRAPAGSNSASGWVLRIMDRAGNYYDDAGRIVPYRANEGHIPIFGNPNWP